MINTTIPQQLLEDFVSRYDAKEKDISTIFSDMQINDEHIKKLLSKYVEYRDESISYYARRFWTEIGKGFKKKPLTTIFRVHSLYREWKRRHDERQQELKTWYLDELQYVIEPETWDEKEKLRSLGVPEEILDETTALTVHNHPLYDAPPIPEEFCESVMKKIREG